MAACSSEFPKTDEFYQDISDDTLTIVLLALACVLTVVCIGIFVEEIVFIQRTYYGNDTRIRKVITILGLFPVTILTSLTSLLVPSSTLLVDLIASCYLSICFYTFVTLTIDYFGGEDRLIEILGDDRVKLNTPPCCCCCCCILRPIKMSRNALLIFKTCSLQVAVVRPVLLFIAAVLWTDGKYEKGLNSSSSSYLYITIVTAISTMTSMYGTVVIYKATEIHLKQYQLHLKYFSFKAMLILVNLQNLIFGILALFDLPECIGTRGTTVRGSYIHHGILVLESFFLTLIARKAYRTDETDIEGPVSGTDAGFGPSDLLQVQSDKSKENADKHHELERETEHLNGAGRLYYDNEAADFDNAAHSNSDNDRKPIDLIGIGTVS